MKRTNLVLDEQLLNEACRLLGEKTYSGAVNRALAETIRSMKVKDIAHFFGSGIWSGNLQEMRDDSHETPAAKSPRRSRRASS